MTEACEVLVPRRDKRSNVNFADPKVCTAREEALIEKNQKCEESS